MDFSRLLYSVDNRICTITINRAEKRNALDDIVVQELAQAFLAASKDQSVRCVIMTGRGSAFCAGADLEYLQKLAEYDFNQNLEDSKNLMRLFQQIYAMRKPVIAKVNGPAVAGGCGLATACDLVIASDEASFGYTELRIGFIPAIVLTFLVRRVGEAKAREIILLGNALTAVEAHRAGIVNEVVAASDLDKRVSSIALSLVENSSGTSIGLLKEMFSRMDGMSFDDMLEYAANMNAAARMSDDCKRGISAFLKKEKIQW